jgi:hypothetical protein
MSFPTETGGSADAPLPLQFVDIKITPIIGGKFSVAMQATLLDEEQLEFIGEDLADAQVETLDEALALIRHNTAILQRPA